VSDLLPAADGLFLGSDTKRWDGSKLANLTAENITQGSVITRPRFVSTVASGTQPYACSSTTRNVNLNADRLDDQHRTAFTRNLQLPSILFIPEEITVDVNETVIASYSATLSTLYKIWFCPSFSAYYKWTDLAGGNPECTLRFYTSIDGGLNYRPLNYVRFHGVDLFKHPVALVRSFIDVFDAAEWSQGMSGIDYVLEVRAVASAGSLVFGDRSLSGLYSDKHAT